MTLRIRPGDVFAAEVSRVNDITDAPVKVPDHIKLVTAWVDLPRQIVPYCIRVSCNTEKLGTVPKPGDVVTVTFREPPPFPYSRPEPMVKGRFYITGISKKECAMFRKSASEPSRDRVSIYIGPKYLQHNKFYAVLEKAFGISECDARAMYRKSDGFHVVCRPSQFARFMIFRNEAGVQNGFMDLQPKLFVPEPDRDPFEELAHVAGVDEDAARSVAEALGFTCRSVMNYLKDSGRGGSCRVQTVDVSKNRYCPD